MRPVTIDEAKWANPGCRECGGRGYLAGVTCACAHRNVFLAVMAEVRYILSGDATDDEHRRWYPALDTIRTVLQPALDEGEWRLAALRYWQGLNVSICAKRLGLAVSTLGLHQREIEKKGGRALVFCGVLPHREFMEKKRGFLRKGA